MDQKKCKNCNKLLNKRKGQTKYCSKKCWKEFEKNNTYATKGSLTRSKKRIGTEQDIDTFKPSTVNWRYMYTPANWIKIVEQLKDKNKRVK